MWGWRVQGDVECWFSATDSMLSEGQKSSVYVSFIERTIFHIFTVSCTVRYKLQTGLPLAFFLTTLFITHRCMEQMSNSCALYRLYHLSCVYFAAYPEEREASAFGIIVVLVHSKQKFVFFQLGPYY